MSVDEGDPFRDARRRDVLGLRPELAAEHARLLATIWDEGDPLLLELCRVRMATLLGATAAQAERSSEAPDSELVERLPAWPHDPGFTDAHRAALAFTEQFVMDHHGITDDHVAALEAALGPARVVVLTTALGVWDTQHRLDNALGVVAP